MRVGNCTYDGKPDAETAGTGRHRPAGWSKQVENMRQQLGRNAEPRVAHAQNQVCWFQIREEVDMLAWRCVLHCVVQDSSVTLVPLCMSTQMHARRTAPYRRLTQANAP